MMLTVGDHVRVKATGEVVVVDGFKDVDGTRMLVCAKFGTPSGMPPTNTDRTPYRREEVTVVELACSWEDAE